VGGSVVTSFLHVTAKLQDRTGAEVKLFSSTSTNMATAFFVGVGAIAAAVAGRTLIRRGVIGGKSAADQWAKGGFKGKMDRKEALLVLGLKYASNIYSMEFVALKL